MAKKDIEQSGKRAALVIAGTGIFWIFITMIGVEMGWSNRVRALFDLAALAGFVYAIVMIYHVWRARQSQQG